MIETNPPDVPQLLLEPNLWQIIDSELNVTIKEDLVGRQATLLVALTAFFHRQPADLLLLGESAIGKTWMAVHVTKLLPPENVNLIGSSTQRAWFYCGKPIYTANPHVKGKKSLSHYEVDWRNKVIVILDNVNERTIKSLKPVMTHDDPSGTISIMATMKTQSGKLKTYPIRILGSPSFINCSTLLRWNEELSTRHFFITPRDDPAKYEAGARLILESEATGREPSGPMSGAVRDAIRYLIERHLKVKIKHEVAEQLKSRFAWKSGRDARDYQRAISLVKSSAWLHAFQRRLDDEGVIIADEKDLEIVEPILVEVLRTSRYGTSSQVLEFRERVLLKLAEEHDWRPFGRDEASRKYVEVYGRPIRYDTLHHMVGTLENIGLLETVQDSTDRRKRLIRIAKHNGAAGYTPPPREGAQFPSTIIPGLTEVHSADSKSTQVQRMTGGERSVG